MLVVHGTADRLAFRRTVSGGPEKVQNVQYGTRQFV
jgi:hypothetical protein